MSPEAKKKFNVAAGSAFIVLGLLCFAVAAYVASVPATPKPAPTNPQPIVSASSCRDTLVQMGYRANLSTGGVDAQENSLEDPHAQLTKATAAIGLCRMKLVEFCMGSGCAEGGLSFKLASLEPKVAAATPAKTATAVKAGAPTQKPTGPNATVKK
jgi:hypothetical protein